MQQNRQPSPIGDWHAPTVEVDSAASARVCIPGSKSLTNRYLLLAALADSPSLIRAPLHSRDSALMIRALQTLGASFEPQETGSFFGPDLRVTPIDFSQTQPVRAQIDVGLAGTVMRFVPPLAALLRGTTTFDGDPPARLRPMGPMLKALSALGAQVHDSGSSSLPFTLSSPGGITVNELSIDASESSQFVSALLLVACRFDRGLTLRHRGGPIPSMPHVQMTLDLLRSVGVEVEEPEPYVWRVAPGGFAGFEVTVEPDLSNAGPFLAAAVALGATVAIPHWPAETSQGGNHWLDILPRFGARVQLNDSSLSVSGPAGGARAGFGGLDLNLAEAGELAPTVAALCALAQTPSRLRGIAHLRGHETNRLAALTTEINRLGGKAIETADGLEILSAADHGALFETYEDHRMATAAAVIGLVVPQVVVRNVDTTAKTLPHFTDLWDSMLAQFTGERPHGC